MDVRKIQVKSTDQKPSEIMSTKVVKRPFDVAFLILPDEKLNQNNNNNNSKIAKTNYEPDMDNCYNEDEEDEEEVDIDIEDTACTEQKVNQQQQQRQQQQQHQKYYTQKQQIFDDPNLTKNKNYEQRKSTAIVAEQLPKSAFTKVNFSTAGKEHSTASLSPVLSLSPDLNYQNSLSPSPPTLSRNYQHFPSNILPVNFKTHQPVALSAAYQANFIADNFHQHHQSFIDGHFLNKTPELLRSNFSKLRPPITTTTTTTIYRPTELSYHNYPQFPNQELLSKINSNELKLAAPSPTTAATPAAAAILTSLLPPSLAALSLPAQNVCAKCNITFRMTSDLVYHMRSHHKNDSNDMNKRRREEKLKCPVCAESFRERHHLTRHMTAHQDKDNDNKDSSSKKD